MEWLQSKLPEGFLHEVAQFLSRGKNGDFVDIPDPTQPPPFHAVIRMNITTEKDAKLWLAAFMQSIGCQYNVRKTNIHSKTSPEFHAHYSCHHSDFNKVVKHEDAKINPKKYKATGCKSTLFIKIKNDTKNVRRHDQYAKIGLLGMAKLDYNHNHSISYVAAIRKRPATEEAKEIKKFMKCFAENMLVPQVAAEVKVEEISDHFEIDTNHGPANSSSVLNECTSAISIIKEEIDDNSEMDTNHDGAANSSSARNECTSAIAFIKEEVPLPVDGPLQVVEPEAHGHPFKQETVTEPNQIDFENVKLEII